MITNKSASYDSISIFVTSIDKYTVTYMLAHSKTMNRQFQWSATIGRDRMTVDALEVGKKYWIRTHSDEFGTQHWVDAKEIVDMRQRPKTDAVTKKVAKEKAKRVVDFDKFFEM